MTSPHASRLLPLVVVLVGGCGGSRAPALTDAQVLVTLNGQPLPNAQVTFLPKDPSYGPDAVSTGVTDGQGVAKMACGAKPGACVGPNRVTVAEGPTPDDTREDSPEAQIKADRFLRGLKNRPIPAKYGNVVEAKLEQVVEKGRSEYKLELTR